MPLVDDQDILTEALGRSGVRFLGFQNPSPFLERTVINRNEAYLMLQGHTINLVAKAGKDPKKKGGKIKVTRSHLDEFTLGRPSFFTATSKMSAASWSIPAGPPSVGGACPSAELFKNMGQYQVALKQGDVEERPASKPDWICQACYAGKSNYMHRTSQYSQTARWIWLKGMVQNKGLDHTVDEVTNALRVHLGNSKQRERVKENPKFFRIHDSGDFTLSPNTYLLWIRVAKNLEADGVSFWAPSRMWTFPKFNELVRDNPPPDNMSLRPSALHFGDRAPDIDGWDGGSTAHDIKVDPVGDGMADWICPAYQHDGHTCAKAGGPQGEVDCRVCWKYTDMAVSYRSH